MCLVASLYLLVLLLEARRSFVLLPLLAADDRAEQPRLHLLRVVASEQGGAHGGSGIGLNGLLLPLLLLLLAPGGGSRLPAVADLLRATQALRLHGAARLRLLLLLGLLGFRLALLLALLRLRRLLLVADMGSGYCRYVVAASSG